MLEEWLSADGTEPTSTVSPKSTISGLEAVTYMQLFKEHISISIYPPGNDPSTIVSSIGNRVSVTMCGTEVRLGGFKHMRELTESRVTLNFDQDGLTVGWTVEPDLYVTGRIERPKEPTPSQVIPSQVHVSRSELDYNRFTPKPEHVSDHEE